MSQVAEASASKVPVHTLSRLLGLCPAEVAFHGDYPGQLCTCRALAQALRRPVAPPVCLTKVEQVRTSIGHACAAKCLTPYVKSSGEHRSTMCIRHAASPPSSYS